MVIRGLLNAYVLWPVTEQVQGRHIATKLRELRRDTAKPFEQILQLQKTRLAEILDIAGADVPYYRDLFRSIGFSPAKVAKDVAYLQDLPYLSKDIIRQQGRRLINPRFGKKVLHERMTSGSTGPSLAVYYSQETLDYAAAANLLVLEWAGKKRHFREVHLASRFPQKFPLKDRLKERIKCAALNRTNIFTDSLDGPGLERIRQRLRRVQPYLLQGHPSTIYALALYLRGRGCSAAGLLKVFESTGELVDEKKRQTIETVFDCRVINRYGNAEFGVVAYEELNGPRQRMKILDLIVYPETADTHAGQDELVLTGLLNPAMPLIRYRTGDLAEIVNDRDGRYLKDLIGRVHDLVQIGSKSYPTHYIQDILEKVGGIDEFQIEERNGRRPLLRLVLSRPEDAPAIQQKIRNLWAESFKTECVSYGQLKRSGRQNKFSYVINVSP